MTTRLFLSALCFTAMLLAQSASAEELRPFHVQYRLYVSKIPTTIKADLWLRETENSDEYEMEMNVKSFLVKNTEKSRFTWKDCHPRTSEYQHSFRGFGKRRNHDMTFSWSPPQVISKEAKETHTLKIEEDTLDDLTILLKARCVFATGDKEFNATSAYGDRLREQHMQVIGREELDTPLGKLDTLLVEKKRGKDSERRTLFWIAPKLNYMLVRAKHIENRALFGELIMRDYDGPLVNKTINPLIDDESAAQQTAEESTTRKTSEETDAKGSTEGS
tara:strand:- start:98788 stop:99615 length:828 start_codon:yes stop_codon:yes gene_type:complete